MLHMYMDLISVGMDINLAKQFYEEIRCLSRANIFPVPQLRAWEVCFSYDYSELVGNLLANYILRDMAIVDSHRSSVNVTRIIEPTAERFLSFGRVNERNRGKFLLYLFSDASSFRAYMAAEEKMEKSCCRSCPSSSYFVNVGKSQCLRNPFGKHCCHKACKSLARLKIGASSSSSYCCSRCRPLQCSR